MLLNPIKPVLQQGVDDYGGASGIQIGSQGQISKPARETTVARSLPAPKEVQAVPIFRDGNKASYFMTGADSMVIFQQHGECQVALPDYGKSVQFKIPGFTITCENIRGHLAVTQICVHNITADQVKYPINLNVAEGSTLSKYLCAERVVPLV